MKYEELEQMWEKDSRMDVECLDQEALKIPLLQSNYFNLLMRERASLKKLHFDVARLRRFKREYYLGEVPAEVLADKGIPVFAKRLVKTDVDVYVDTDDEVVALLEKVAVVQSKVDFLDLCVKSLNNRSFMIKNAIDFLKFKHGVV